MPEQGRDEEVRCWINTVSREHTLAGVDGGFTQADHGRDTSLRRLTRGDWIAFYSPRSHFHGGEPLQCFTAIGRIADDEPYQVEMTPDFHPWRRKVEFLPCSEGPIRPLIDELGFIHDKQRWGFPFRRGLFEVPQADFERIARSMRTEVEGIRSGS